MNRSFSRRDLLQAAGTSLAVPAFLRQAFAAPAELPPRLVIFMQANGTHQNSFWPDASFRSPILDPLLANPSLAAQTTVLKGVKLDALGPGNEHDRGFHSFWTGVPSVGTPADSWGGGPSIDQILRRALQPSVRYPTLNCGVQAANIGPKNGHRTSFSYIAEKKQVPTQTDPLRLYAALFRGSDPNSTDPAVAARRLRQKKSVMDYVATDLQSLARRLPAPEAHKLATHTEALRDMEKRLRLLVPPPPGASCGWTTRDAKPLDAQNEDNVPALMELMIDLVAQATICNLTRFVTVPFGYGGNQWLFKWLGLGVDWHAEVAHKDLGIDAVAADRMTLINKWHCGYVARLANAMANVPESGGTVLDHSLIVWANENATGFHVLENIPVVLIGRAGGRLKNPGRVIDQGPQSNHRVATSVMNLCGVEAAGFGNQPTCGGFRGLE